MRFPGAWLLIGLTCASGCASMKDCVDECMITMRNCRAARRAWKDYQPCVETMDNEKHFARGFKDGYAEVAGGGSPCLPALPPECYWRFCHESTEGQARMTAWFEGYAHGALLAERQGIAQASYIVIAPSITPPSQRQRPPATSLRTAVPDSSPPVVPFDAMPVPVTVPVLPE
jgi:hypothetical protein